MATGAIPPGGIVPVPDPITGGAGAPVMVANIVNAMWINAAKKYLDATDQAKTAIGLAEPAPQMVAPTLDMSYLPPLPPDLPPPDPNRILGIYEDERRALEALIEGAFNDFLATYFPNRKYYNDAMDWCDRAIVQGGTGMNTDVEQALWQRDRARILGDSFRTEDEAMATWSNKRFPLPPGALTNQVNQIRLDAGKKLAESSRTVMTKSWDSELENIKFAVKTIVDQIKVALDAAGDYIKTIMLGPQTAMQLATGLAGIQTQFYNALTAMYSAQVAALEPRIRLQITDAQLKLTAETENLKASMSSIEQQVRAALQAAQAAASMASAGINGVNAQSSVSGVDQSQI